VDNSSVVGECFDGFYKHFKQCRLDFTTNWQGRPWQATTNNSKRSTTDNVKDNTLAIGSGAAGQEIEGPLAVVILGGLITSTALNLLVLPTLARRSGRFEARSPRR
jgi:hypothetical protein